MDTTGSRTRGQGAEEAQGEVLRAIGSDHDGPKSEQEAAFLIMWADVTPELEAGYSVWHTSQHVRERMAMPGFRTAWRYVSDLPMHRYLTLYELSDLSALRTPEYTALLNTVAPETERYLGGFRNFTRAACKTAYAYASGVGGVAGAWWFDSGSAASAELLEPLQRLSSAVAGAPGVLAVRSGVADESGSALHTREGEIRARVAADKTITAATVVECIAEEYLARVSPELRAAFQQLAPSPTMMKCGTYRLAALLRP